MPIKEENKKYYEGKQWQYFRAWALERAEHQCQLCGVDNYAVVTYNENGKREIDSTEQYLDINGVPRIYSEARSYADMMNRDVPNMKFIVIVLTIAHLDHNPENNHPDNLRALCQKCHLNHDKELHKKNAAETRRKKFESGMTLFQARNVK